MLMIRITFLALTMISVVVTALFADTEDSLALDFRLAPALNDFKIVCRLKNESTESVNTRAIMYGANLLFRIQADDSERLELPIFRHSTRSYQDLVIPAGGSCTWRLAISDINHIVFLGRERGRYTLLRWQAEQHSTKPICVGFARPGGFMDPPVVDPTDSTAKPILAVIFDAKQTRDLGFLFLNGSNETVTVEKPLTQASRIVVTAPAIEYTKELFVAGQTAEYIEIEGGNVGEWRIPWQKVYELIPESDLVKIIDAGGNVDLVWKFGQYESAPLPITLCTVDLE
jgi:hypothetical protein